MVINLESHARLLEQQLEAMTVALEAVIGQQPCCEGGGCFYPIHDGEGNPIGEQNIDPISVIGGMVQTAQEAFFAIKEMNKQ